jgi:hypothetical protein
VAHEQALATFEICKLRVALRACPQLWLWNRFCDWMRRKLSPKFGKLVELIS